jgi:uncharacterized protein (DUF885 family)
MPQPSRPTLPRALLALALGAALAGCGPAPQAPAGAEVAQTQAVASAEQRAEVLEQLFADYWEEQLQRNPLRATAVGDHRFNDQLPNTLAPEYRAESQRLARAWLERVRAVPADGLEGQALLSREVFIHMLERELAGYAFPSELMPLNQFYNLAGQFAMLGSGQGSQPFRDVQDYEHWLARARQVPPLLAQVQANLREGMAAGVTQPRVLIERVIPQLEALIKDDPSETLFW